MASSRLIGRMRAVLGLDDTEFQRGVRGAEASLQRMGRRLTVAGAAFSAAGAGIALAIRGQLNAADQMTKDAQKIGIPVDDLSRLAHAADMSGVSMGSLQTAVGRLSRQIASTPDRFRKLGIAVEDAQGNLRPTADVLSDVAQVLSEMPDGAEKTALAMELMGRGGAELIPMLNGGRDALRGMMDEADSLGIVITPEMGRNAEQFGDNLSRLQKQMGGIATMVTANLAPALTRISDMVVAFAARFRELSPRLQTFISTLAAAVIVIGPVLTGLGLMTMAISPFIKAVIGAGAAIRAMSSALLANPIGLIAAAIAGAAYLIYKEWDWVGPWFSEMWDKVRAIFGGFKDFVGGIFSGDLSRAWGGIKAVWSGVQGFFQTLWDGVAGVFTYAWEHLIKPVTDALGMTENIERGWQRLSGALDSILSTIGSAFDSLMDRIRPVIDALKWVWDNASELGGRLRNIGRRDNGTVAPEGFDVIAPPAPTADMRQGLAGGTAGIRVQGIEDANAYGQGFSTGMGIRSPSRVMMGYGRFIAEGLGIGIDQGQAHVAAATDRLGDTMKMRIADTIDGLITRTTTLEVEFARTLQRMADRIRRSGIDQLINGLFGRIGGGFLGRLLGVDPLTAALNNAISIPGFARGTPFSPEGLARVNERGGEILDLPGGTRVFPADLSRRMADAEAAPGTGHLSIGFDASVGDLTAVMYDVAGNVVASARQSIVGDAVGAVRVGARKSKGFLGV
ncbi:phage tail tape measure protein [Paracoccus bogoriensis]|uniref:phage tail tape measure protein n=1 Tax=Paracoccus bogoriensis TaxID=242065 RepID=UPI001CA4D13C|nr:phage tail tape measure protein [Paracoccus bogoriensis]